MPTQPSYLSCAQIKDGDLVIGANQAEYETITGRLEEEDDGTPIIVTEWSLTDEQRQRVADGENIFLAQYGGGWVPAHLAVCEASPDPKDEERVIG